MVCPTTTAVAPVAYVTTKSACGIPAGYVAAATVPAASALNKSCAFPWIPLLLVLLGFLVVSLITGALVKNIVRPTPVVPQSGITPLTRWTDVIAAASKGPVVVVYTMPGCDACKHIINELSQGTARDLQKRGIRVVTIDYNAADAPQEAYPHIAFLKPSNVAGQPARQDFDGDWSSAKAISDGVQRFVAIPVNNLPLTPVGPHIWPTPAGNGGNIPAANVGTGGAAGGAATGAAAGAERATGTAWSAGAAVRQAGMYVPTADQISEAMHSLSSQVGTAIHGGAQRFAAYA